MLRFNPVTGQLDIAPVWSQRPGPPGHDGDPGDPGDPGKDGEDGKDGRHGKDGENGKDGKDGKDGRDGNTLLHGTSPPTNDLGRPNDFYIDIVRWNIYGPKRLDNNWGPGVSLKGAPGDAGKDGKDGQDGKDGENGKDGKEGKNGKDGERGPRGLQGPAGDPPTGTFRLVPDEAHTHRIVPSMVIA